MTRRARYRLRSVQGRRRRGQVERVLSTALVPRQWRCDSEHSRYQTGPRGSPGSSADSLRSLSPHQRRPGPRGLAIARCIGVRALERIECVVSEHGAITLAIVAQGGCSRCHTGRRVPAPAALSRSRWQLWQSTFVAASTPLGWQSSHVTNAPASTAVWAARLDAGQGLVVDVRQVDLSDDGVAAPVLLGKVWQRSVPGSIACSPSVPARSLAISRWQLWHLPGVRQLDRLLFSACAFSGSRARCSRPAPRKSLARHRPEGETGPGFSRPVAFR